MVEHCVNNNLLDELYWYYRLRNIYSNNTFYNYSFRSISKVLGCSVSTAHRVISRIIQYGWAIKTNKGHLKLLGINKLWLKFAPQKMIAKGKKPFIIQVTKSKIKSQQIVYFRSVILSNNLCGQLKEIVKKTKIVHNCKNNAFLTKRQLRKIQKSGGEKEVLNERFLNKRLTLSNTKIGKELLRSVSSAKRYTKKMRELGVFKITPHYRFVEHGVSPLKFNYKYGNSRNFQYSKKERSVYSQESNTFKLPKELFNSIYNKYTSNNTIIKKESGMQ